MEGAVVRPHSLTICTRLAYSVGHVLNDLCASMWFTYMMIYFHYIVQFSNQMAGTLLLIGQIADGIATPFVGLESDRTDNFWLCRYGRRKTWHLFGTICVLASFPFLFIQCIGCQHAHQSAQFYYYAAFIVIFQFGWASVQISHLSLIPDLTRLSHERVELNSLRYAFTVISNISVYGLTWLFLGVQDQNNDEKAQTILPSDNLSFKNTVLTVVGIGAFFSMLFHVFVKEPPPVDQIAHITESINQNLESTSVEVSVHLRWKDWFKDIQFYKIGLLYMATRLYVNLSQVYFPFFLQESLGLHRNSIATIPLVIYVSGFVASFLVNFSNKRAGHKLTYFFAVLLAITASIWIYFAKYDLHDLYKFKLVYLNASLVGVAGSAMLITSLAMTSDLIGHNTTSGAFVFGAMSLLDKLSNGIAVMLIQYLHPCSSHCELCKWYYSTILTFVCGGAAVLGLIALSLLAFQPIEASRRFIFVQSNEDGTGFTVQKEKDTSSLVIT